MKVEGTEKRKRGRPFLKKEIDLSKILEIAIKSFADEGFKGTSMKTIAEEAGYTKAVLHYHFTNKENLWKEAMLHLNKKLIQRYEYIQGYFKDLEGLAALKAYTRQFIYFSAEHPEYYKLAFHEMCTKTERATWFIENIASPINNLFIEENKKIKDKQLIFKGYPAANMSTILYGAANIFFIHAFQMENMYGINPFEKKEIERHADIVVDLLYARYKD